MELLTETYQLQFKTPFSISHGTRTHTPAVFLTIKDAGFTGYGEAALPPYLPETVESVEAFIKGETKTIHKLIEDPALLPNWLSHVTSDHAAKACVEMAICDLTARKKKVSLSAYLNCDKGNKDPDCSLTIGLGSLEDLEITLHNHPDFALFKLKLDGKDDLERVKKARALTTAQIAVDVNGGWEDVYQAIDLIAQFRDFGVILVEQPFKKDEFRKYEQLKATSALPVIGDESVRTCKELEERYQLFHGINIKLMKCPGLYQALKMISFCREKGLKVLLGCMSESSCGVAAAASLKSLADWIDLDGPLLISNDPFEGVLYKKGKIAVKENTGIGIERKQK